MRLRSFASILALLTLGSVIARQLYAGPGRTSAGSVIVDLVELLAMLALALVLVRAQTQGSGERRSLMLLALLALVPRLVAALALHSYGLSISPRGIALDDESSYDFAARELVRELAGGAPLASEWWHLEGHQLSFLTALYTVLGPAPLFARIGGACLGAAAAVLAALAARDVFGRSVGVVVGIVFAVVPSLVIWSATLIKEPMVTALVVLVFWAAVRWRTAPRWQLGVLVLAALQTLTSVRLYAGLGLTLLIAAALALSMIGHVWRFRLSRWLLAVTVLGLVSLTWLQWNALRSATDPVRLVYYQTVIRLVPPPADRLPADVAPEDRIGGVVGGPIVVVDMDTQGTQAPGMIVGRRGSDALYVAFTRDQIDLVPASQIRPVQDMDPLQAQRHLVQGFGQDLRRVLLAPLDAPLTSPVHLALAADALVWLGLLTCGVLGALRTRQPIVLLPLAFTASMLVVQAVVGGNVGNVIRQRAILGMPGLIIAGGPVLAMLAHMLFARVRPIARASSRTAEHGTPEAVVPDPAIR